MKVQNLNPANVSSPSVPANRSADAPTSGAGSARFPGGRSRRDDNVQISTFSSQLSSLDTASYASRVTELSSAVSSNSYHVDAMLLSDKLIREHMRIAA